MRSVVGQCGTPYYWHLKRYLARSGSPTSWPAQWSTPVLLAGNFKTIIRPWDYDVITTLDTHKEETKHKPHTTHSGIVMNYMNVQITRCLLHTFLDCLAKYMLPVLLGELDPTCHRRDIPHSGSSDIGYAIVQLHTDKPLCIKAHKMGSNHSVEVVDLQETFMITE